MLALGLPPYTDDSEDRK
jgi:hypothetical protein